MATWHIEIEAAQPGSVSWVRETLAPWIIRRGFDFAAEFWEDERCLHLRFYPESYPATEEALCRLRAEAPKPAPDSCIDWCIRREI